MAQSTLVVYLASMAVIFAIVAGLLSVYITRARSHRKNTYVPGAPAIDKEEVSRLGERPGGQRADPRGVDVGGTFSNAATGQGVEAQHKIHRERRAS